jgi:uncharacterized protein
MPGANGPIQRRDQHFPGRAPIEAYGNGGFRFADMSHRGAILCLPSGIHGWDAVDASAFNDALIDRLLTERAGADDPFGFLLFGTGHDPAGVPDPIRWRLRAVGVSLDAMTTGAAIRTYNIMLAENRPVAAAFLPVG